MASVYTPEVMYYICIYFNVCPTSNNVHIIYTYHTYQPLHVCTIGMAFLDCILTSGLNL